MLSGVWSIPEAIFALGHMRRPFRNAREQAWTSFTKQIFTEPQKFLLNYLEKTVCLLFSWPMANQSDDGIRQRKEKGMTTDPHSEAQTGSVSTKNLTGNTPCGMIHFTTLKEKKKYHRDMLRRRGYLSCEVRKTKERRVLFGWIVIFFTGSFSLQPPPTLTASKSPKICI